MITIDPNRILTNHEIVQKDDQERDLFAELGIDPSKNTLDIRSGKIVVIDPTIWRIFLMRIVKKNSF